MTTTTGLLYTTAEAKQAYWRRVRSSFWVTTTTGGLSTPGEAFGYARELGKAFETHAV